MNTSSLSHLAKPGPMLPADSIVPSSQAALRVYSKIVCLAVFSLIFAGAMVTSNNAGLAVPDWPTSYGQNMFTFPPSKWVGGIFYEHVHRLIASSIGALTVVLTIWICIVERRVWVRRLTYVAMAAVILQGLLGGLTVLYKLPDAISVAHGVLGQTFFVLTIIIAYSQSQEFIRAPHACAVAAPVRSGLILWSVVMCLAVYAQLIVGAWMRHSASGLAIPDFPTMGGTFRPQFDALMLNQIEIFRRNHGVFPAEVTLLQVGIHFMHRVWALVVVACVLFYCSQALLRKNPVALIRRTSVYLFLLVLLQAGLGILTILTLRQPVTTSIHVLCGAALLGVSVLAVLRSTLLTRSAEESRI